MVRESLTRLAEQSLVISELRIGVRVGRLSLDDLRGRTAIRASIEGMALRYSVERGDVEWEARLVAAHHLPERTPLPADDEPPRVSDDWEVAHAAFRTALIDGCRGPDFRVGLSRSATPPSSIAAGPSPTIGDVAREHRGILDASLARDPDLAVERLQAHFCRTAEILGQTLLRDPRLSPYDALLTRRKHRWRRPNPSRSATRGPTTC